MVEGVRMEKHNGGERDEIEAAIAASDLDLARELYADAKARGGLSGHDQAELVKAMDRAERLLKDDKTTKTTKTKK